MIRIAVNSTGSDQNNRLRRQLPSSAGNTSGRVSAADSVSPTSMPLA